MRKYFFILCFVLLTDASYALSPLPRNSYLRLGDNQKEVKILQQILNSDPDTEIVDVGPGSPGNENWYFGQMTENALRRFQEKNNLEVTGRIDFKTWKVLNNFALGTSEITSPSNTNIQNKIESANEKRLSINEQNKKDFEAAKKLKAEKTKEEAAAKKSESKSYIESLLDKYTGFFYTSKGDAEKDKQNSGIAKSTQDIYSNTPSSQTPYLNPNTGIYSSNPAYTQQGQQPLTPQSPYSQLFGNQSPYATYTGNPYANINAPGQYASQAPFVNGPMLPGAEQSAGQTQGRVGKIGRCKATTFAHSIMSEGCRADGIDKQNDYRPASFSTYKIYLSRPGVPAIPAVASWAGSFGDAVEVKLPDGRCKAFPLMERGPGKIPLTRGVCIDLTGSAADILYGNAPCKSVGNEGRLEHSLGMVDYAFIPGEKIQPGQTKECTHLVK